MKTSLQSTQRWLSMLTVSSLTVLAGARSAAADDALDGGRDAGTLIDASSNESSGTRLACDGALCDTSNGSTCTIGKGNIGLARADTQCLMAICVALAWGAAQRIRRRSI